MIKPIIASRFVVNQTSQPNKASTSNIAFTGQYIPHEPHVTADLTFNKTRIEKLYDVLFPSSKATLEQKSSIIEKAIDKITNKGGLNSDCAIITASDMFDTKTGAISHLLPDGTPIELVADDIDIDEAAEAVGSVIEKIANTLDFFV